MLARPGFHTSEFIVALSTAILNIANASQHWVTWQQAVGPTLAAVAYVLSRGFAKTETRVTAAPKSSPPPGP